MCKALFLDRDGVINVDRENVHRVEDFAFVDGIMELCNTARDLGFRLVIVTNQGGIGRDLYSETDFAKLTEWMVARFAERGIVIARVYHCPYHPERGVGHYRRRSYFRKPNPGMILKARDALGLDLGASVLVGDKDSDIEAGRTAGVGCNVLYAPVSEADTHADHVFSSLADIARWLETRAGAPAAARHCQRSAEEGG